MGMFQYMVSMFQYKVAQRLQLHFQLVWLQELKTTDLARSAHLKTLKIGHTFDHHEHLTMKRPSMTSQHLIIKQASKTSIGLAFLTLMRFLIDKMRNLPRCADSFVVRHLLPDLISTLNEEICQLWFSRQVGITGCGHHKRKDQGTTKVYFLSILNSKLWFINH